MSRKSIIWIAAAAVVLGAAYYFYGGSSTPKGQPSLVSLKEENFSSLKDAFNQSAGSARVVLMLSPT